MGSAVATVMDHQSLPPLPSGEEIRFDGVNTTGDWYLPNDTSATNHLRSSSWSPPDGSPAAVSTSHTTTVINQRSMWWFGTVPRRAAAKGQYSFIYRTAPHQETRPTKLLSAFVTHAV